MSISPWQNEESLSDINVTPFVDVLLVLLIIFMVTAPIVHHVIEVDLPQDSYNQDEMKPLQEPLRIVIDSKGVLYIGEEKIGASKDPRIQSMLQDSVRLWAKQQTEPYVDIEADEKVQYGEIVPVIARLKELQVGLNLVIRPKPKK